MQSGHQLAKLANIAVLAAAISSGQIHAQTTTEVKQPTDLGNRIAKIANETDVECSIGVYVAESKSGKLIVDIDGDEFMIPASCNKLLTTAAGLHAFGPDYTFKTSLYADGEIKDGTLTGDLIVYGTGDPGIGARFLDDKKDVTRFFREWAGKLQEKGIRKITGNIVADDSYFDDNYFHNNWYPRERAEWYSAEVGALSFNDNCIDLVWDTKSALPGDTLKSFTMIPQTKYATVSPEIEVVAKGRSWEIQYKRDEGSNSIVAGGTLVVDHVKNDSAAITDPALYTVTVLHETLTSQGIAIEGKPKKIRNIVPEKKPPFLFAHSSAPLSDIVNIINRNSQNFYAEAVFKALGKKEYNKGTYPDGAKAVTKWLKDSGIYKEGHNMVDGSGMAGENKVSPHMLTEILRVMDGGKYREEYRTSLPVGGKSGSIIGRFKSHPRAAELASRVMAKTGGIGGVRTLSGIVTDDDGVEYYFSVMLNDLRDHNAGTQLIDDIVMEIAGNSKKK